MTVEVSLGIGVALVAYGTSVSIDVELPNGRHFSPAAAFGPALASLGAGGYEVAPSLLLFGVAVVLEVTVSALMRRRAFAGVLRVAALSMSFALVFLTGSMGALVGAPFSLALIGGVVCGSLTYYGLDLLGLDPVRRSRLWRRRFLENARASLPLAVVMTSTAGLIALVYPHLSWGAFAVMYLPVLAARHEFERYGEARRTYHQTVSALAALTEGAGYVPEGHHSRVAQIALEVARELGLSSEKGRELELVGLLHDVGTVSLPDASDVQGVDPQVVAANSGRLLEATGHLAKYAAVVHEAVGAGNKISIEARILGLADAYDNLQGTRMDRLRQLSGELGPGDEVLAALSRVTERIGG